MQVYEREDGHRGRDAVLVRDGEPVATVIDLPWQEDDPTQLERARATPGRVMLAGGLAADNVREAIAGVRPWAVDASSRLEVSPGVKDPDAVRAFVEAARA
jgi:phosphoribosylanthranilate isomerase